MSLPAFCFPGFRFGKGQMSFLEFFCCALVSVPPLSMSRAKLRARHFVFPQKVIYSHLNFFSGGVKVFLKLHVKSRDTLLLPKFPRPAQTLPINLNFRESEGRVTLLSLFPLPPRKPELFSDPGRVTPFFSFFSSSPNR